MKKKCKKGYNMRKGKCTPSKSSKRSYNNSSISLVLIVLGLIIVFGTHLFMVAQFFNDGIGALGISHAVINLTAGVLILIGYKIK